MHAASLFVVWPAAVPAIVGATAPSTSITVVVAFTVGVAKALETSAQREGRRRLAARRARRRREREPSSSPVTVAAEPLSV